MTESAKATGRGREYRGQRAATNALASLVGNLIVVLLAIVTTPVLLHRLGLVEFGIIGLATATVGYLSTIDPGFSNMVVRYGAQGRVRGDEALGARVCAVGTLAWFVIGAVLTPVVWFVVPLFLRHAHYSAGLVHPAELFFFWSYGLMVFGSLTSMIAGRLTAAGEQYLLNLIDVGTRVVYAVVLVALLWHGWRLSAVVAATSVQSGLGFLFTIALVRRRHGTVYANPRHLPADVRREIANFGGRFQLNAILDTLTYETDPVVLTLMVSARATGLWSIANRLARQVTYFGYASSNSILPAIAASVGANEGNAALQRLYKRANQIIVLNGALLCGVVIAFGPLLFRLWLGNAYHQASTPLILVAVAMVMGMPRPATAAAIFALGKVGLGVRAQVLAFVVNVALTLALVGPWHLNGVLFGTVVAKFVATTYLLLRFCRLIEADPRSLILSWLAPLVLVTTVTTTVSHVLMDRWVAAFSSRPMALLGLLTLGAFFALLFAVGLRLGRYFTRDDLRWLRAALPKPLRPALPDRLIGLLAVEA